MGTQSNIIGRLATFSARLKWLVLAGWVCILAIAFVLAGHVGDSFGKNTMGPVTEAEKAQEVIDSTFDDQAPMEWVIVESEAVNVNDPAFSQFVGDLQAQLTGMDTVTGVVSYLDGAEGLVTADANAALIQVTMLDNDDAQQSAVPIVAAVMEADADPMFRVTVAGDGSIDIEFNKMAEDTLAKGELIGITVALVILLVVFGAAVAASFDG